MKLPFDKNMSEFDWEREIRKDEARINTYLNELNEFLDLPDEEQMIMKKLQRHPELIPNNMNNMNFGSVFDEMDEDMPETEDFHKKEGSDIYIQLEKLAYHWNTIFAGEISKMNIASGMIITCFYGKIMARMADVLDIGEDGFKNLRIAICKRLIDDLSKLSNEFTALSTRETSIKVIIDTHNSHVHLIREKILDMLNRIRSKKE